MKDHTKRDYNERILIVLIVFKSRCVCHLSLSPFRPPRLDVHAAVIPTISNVSCDAISTQHNDADRQPRAKLITYRRMQKIWRHSHIVYGDLTLATNNKWSKNFYQRPHRRGRIFTEKST